MTWKKLTENGCSDRVEACDSPPHARIQEFLPGGGGSRPDCQKTALTIF